MFITLFLIIIYLFIYLDQWKVICMNSHVVKLSYTKMLDIYFIF